MTIIAAALGDGYAVVGADGRSTSSGYIIQDSTKKLIHTADMVVGHAGGLRGKQILCEVLADYDEPEMICSQFKQELIKDGWRWSGDKGSQYGDERALFVTPKKILVMDSDFALWEPSDGFWAIGSGEDFALGAMFTAHGLSANQLVTRALNAACKFRSDCGGEWQIEEVR